MSNANDHPSKSFQAQPLVALIPIKGEDNKSRLSSVLSALQREELSRWMLRKTLYAVCALPEIATVRLIGKHPESLSADIEGCQYVQEREPTLNGALQAEVDLYLGKGNAVLILFADLPLIDSSVISAFIESAQATFSLAPDVLERGTNALLYRGQCPLKMRYGAGSFPNYLKQAEAQGAKARVFRHPALAQDLDTPEDWTRLKSGLFALGFSLGVQTAP